MGFTLRPMRSHWGLGGYSCGFSRSKISSRSSSPSSARAKIGTKAFRWPPKSSYSSQACNSNHSPFFSNCAPRSTSLKFLEPKTFEFQSGAARNLPSSGSRRRKYRRPSSGVSSCSTTCRICPALARSSARSTAGSRARTPGKSRSVRRHISSIKSLACGSSTPKFMQAVTPRVRALLHSNGGMKCTAAHASTKALRYSPRCSSASARVASNSVNC
mmetsp:Transcript_56454/g.163722  ORF Transcript_56454/g.163722 Transcript_56454/m.163722 type:complete len:216 (-) Transcript_56454:583-1230(-)